MCVQLCMYVCVYVLLMLVVLPECLLVSEPQLPPCALLEFDVQVDD